MDIDLTTIASLYPQLVFMIRLCCWFICIGDASGPTGVANVGSTIDEGLTVSDGWGKGSWKDSQRCPSIRKRREKSEVARIGHYYDRTENCQDKRAAEIRGGPDVVRL